MTSRNQPPSKYSAAPAISLAAVLLLPVSLPVAAQHADTPQKLAGARQVFDGAMLPDVEVNTFSHSDKLFPVNIVKRGGAVRPFAMASETLQSKARQVHFEARGRRFDLYDYLAFDRVAGLMVLKDGKVVMEDYELGVEPETRWISFSMAKSISSTLVGAAISCGAA